MGVLASWDIVRPYAIILLYQNGCMRGGRECSLCLLPLYEQERVSQIIYYENADGNNTRETYESAGSYKGQ